MIDIRDLNHTYPGNIVGVENVNLYIGEGEIVAVIGVSGAGKSTLLRCINRLLEPTSGKIYIRGEEILNCTEREAELIRRQIGMVFQNFNLIQRSTVLQNVLLGRLGHILTWRSLLFGKAFSKKDKEIALEALKKVRMEELTYRRADALSGGQQQRVGIARALAQNPVIILGDEPVSNLDPTRKKEIMYLLSDIHKKEKLTTIVSIHDLEVAKAYTDRIIGMVKGKVVFDGPPKELTDEKIMEIFA